VSTWPLSGVSLRAGRLVQASAVALGAALLASILYRVGWHRVWLDLQSMGWRFVSIVALEVLVSGANARAWWHTLPRQTRHSAFPRLFLVQLAGSALNETALGAPLYGEPVKVLLLRERSPVSVTTASLLSVKLAQALASVLFIIVGLLVASWSLKFERLPVWSLSVAFVLIAAGVGTFLALQLRGFSGLTRRVSTRVPVLGSWVGRMEHGLRRVDEHLQELYRSRPLDFVAAVMLVLAGLCVGIVQIWLMMRWIGLRQDWLSSLTIEAFSVLVSFVSFVVPGALGVQEGGKALIFAALGLPVAAGVTVGVACRVNNMLTVAIGLVAFVWLKPHRLFGAARGELWPQPHQRREMTTD
jgi:uncharacterized protein (TIRG00374 family)